MKLWAMACRATQDRRVSVESSDKMWSTKCGVQLGFAKWKNVFPSVSFWDSVFVIFSFDVSYINFLLIGWKKIQKFWQNKKIHICLWYICWYLHKYPASHLIYISYSKLYLGFPAGSAVKNPSANAGDAGLIPRSGRSPGEGNGNHSSIVAWEIPWTAWQATVHVVAKSQTQFRDWACKQIIHIIK